ncbi:ATP-binding protein [Streptomyces sp. NPDC006516]|uniref:ATP-binding protein n=1 Tax=Streptomyces sp. NPDC006516 TaxID=3154309 RepID=UPI0033BBE1AD
MTDDGPLLVGSRVQQARDRAFTGRTAELAVFRAALAGSQGAPSVLYVHGPGGIGKSMLMRRFAAEARNAGRDVLEVDARITQPTPEAFGKEAAPVLTDERSVLLIDTFERCQALEGWLRDRFLPQLPEGTVVVIAGRHAPDPAWSSDPGWSTLLRTIALRNLAPDEAAAFLEGQGVPRATRTALLTFTGGHPLALALAAAVAAKDEGATGWEPGRDVIGTLLAQLVGELPSPLHRRALEVCARAYMTTESLLRAVLADDAAPIFAWLRDLPFIESAQQGLFPHDVVRQTLEADLRWRDPEGYAELHSRISRHLFDQIRLSSESGTLPAVGAFMYLYRDDRHMSAYNSWREGEVRLTACEPADHAAVLDLAALVEGSESAAMASHWLSRQPEAFRVCRTTQDDRVVGFSAWLRLTEPSGADTDPVVAAAWRHTLANAALRGGEHLAISRFSVTSPEYPKISPVEDLHQWRALAEVARADNRLTWTYIMVRSAEFWTPYLTSLGLQPLPERPRVGQIDYALFATDWRAQPVWAWAEQKTRLMLARIPGAPAKAPQSRDSDRSEVFAVLSRPEFDTALKDALRALTQADELAKNPLCHSRLVAGQGLSLRQVLEQALESLRHQRGGEKCHRVLVATYLSRNRPTQQGTAARLGLPFSTFRRHLTEGITRLGDALWHQEMYGVEPAERT